MERIFSLALLAYPLLLQAQHGYLVEVTTQPYQELVSPAPCTFVEGFHRMTELDGETFRFFDTDFVLDSAMVGDDGHLRFDASAGSVIIDGLFAFLAPIDASTNIGYSLSGAPGAGTLVAEWRNWELTNGPNGNYANWQIAVEQATGIVEIRFGPNSGGEDIYTSVDGPHSGMFWSNTAFTTCYARLWFEQDAEIPTLDSMANFDFDALHEPPLPNTVYRLTPLAQVGMGESSATEAMTVVVGTGQLQVAVPVEYVGGMLRVLDVSGKEVHRQTVPAPQAVVALAGIASGCYTVLLNAEGSMARARFAFLE